MSNLAVFARFLLICFVLEACAHKDKRLLHLEPADSLIDWQELTEPDLESQNEIDTPTELSSVGVKLPDLSIAIASDPSLLQLSHARALENPKFYHNGIYGKLEASTMFVSTLDRIPDWTRLYWIMVRVLSEKYGCFIKDQTQSDNLISFLCRDSRTVNFWRSRGKNWIQFVARQYDRFGDELYIRNHQKQDAEYSR